MAQPDCAGAPRGNRLPARGAIPCREGRGKARAAGQGGSEPRGPGVPALAVGGMLFSPRSGRAGGGSRWLFGHIPQLGLAPLC